MARQEGKVTDTASNAAGTEQAAAPAPAAKDGAWARSSNAHAVDFEKPRSPWGLRAAALLIWLLGLAVEVLVALFIGGTLHIPNLELPPLLLVVVALFVNLLLMVLGARLWKMAAVRKAQAKGTSAPTGAGVVRVALSTMVFLPMALYFALAKNASGLVRLISVVSALVMVAILTALVILL